MEISQQAARRILQELQAKVGRGPLGIACPFCTQTAGWNLDPTIFQLAQFAGGSVVLGGPVMPILTLTCKHCGHVELVNAVFWKALDATGRPALE